MSEDSNMSQIYNNHGGILNKYYGECSLIHRLFNSAYQLLVMQWIFMVMVMSFLFINMEVPK